MSRFFKNTLIWIAYVLAGQVHAQSVFNVLDSSSRVLGKPVLYNQSIYTNGATYNPSGSGTLVLMKFSMNNGSALVADTFSVDGVASYNGNIAILNEKLIIYSTHNPIPPYNLSSGDLQLTFCDTNFNVQDSTVFGGGGVELSYDLNSIGNYIFTFGVTTSYGAGSGDFYLNKWDTLGNLIWSETYGTTNSENARSFTDTEDGNLILLGGTQITSSNWDLYLVKVDQADGQVIWEKAYGGAYEDYTGEITALQDHSFIVYHNVDYGTYTVGYIDKLDGNGDLVWSRAFPYNNLSSFGYGRAIENSDGTLLVNCAVKNSNGSMISRILKLTPLGDTIWTKEYYTNPNMPQYINGIKPTPDGGYIFCGSARDSNLEQRAWLIKTNCNGEEGVQHPITGAPCDQYDCTLYPVDANFTPSTSYVDLGIESGLVTFENNSANATSRVWHFGDGTTDYTDSIISYTYTQPGIYEVELIIYHGMCSDTVTHTVEVINTAGMLSPNLDYGVSVYPNPSNGSFVLSFKHAPEGNFEIIDLAGRIHHSEKLNGALSYSINDLHAGAYLLRIYYPSGVSETKRVIVE